MTDVVTFAGRQGQVNTTGVGAFIVAISAIFLMYFNCTFRSFCNLILYTPLQFDEGVLLRMLNFVASWVS